MNASKSLTRGGARRSDKRSKEVEILGLDAARRVPQTEGDVVGRVSQGGNSPCQAREKRIWTKRGS